MGPNDGCVEALQEGQPGIDDVQAAERHALRAKVEGLVGLKRTIEPGYLPTVHSSDLRHGIAAVAGSHELPLFVHAQHRTAHLDAIELGPRAILHMVRDAMGDLPKRLVCADIPVVGTLHIDHGPLVYEDPSLLDEPLLRQVVPAAKRETATTGAGWRRYKVAMTRVSLPHSPLAVQSLAPRLMPVADFMAAASVRSNANTRPMHRAGVRLVMGSDSGAYDQIPFFAHGLSSLREIELLAQAGLSPEEALLAATRDAADLLGLSGELGTLSVGASSLGGAP